MKKTVLSQKQRDERRREAALLAARRQSANEQAVLVSVRFRRELQLTPSQRLARATAVLTGDADPTHRDEAAMNGAPGDASHEDADPTHREEAAINGAPDAVLHGAPAVVADDVDAALEEFRELARSAGAEEIALLVQQRQKPDPATLVGGGKLDEIVAVVESTGASLVLFDHDLTPSQARNVEERLPCTVIDRSQLILDIFARHARTREGMLQVELAQLEYKLPRLAGKGKAMSQLGGGIGTRGPGETKLETDKRRIRARIDHLKEQIEGVRRIRRQQRSRREAVPVPAVALVGYTNAGKSTLFNALTGAEVLESEQMFATLDPKLKQLTLPSRRRVLLSDTVGFVRDLPHSLVSAFRATLEEVERAAVLVHVRDASSPMLEAQREQVMAVLNELEVRETPMLDVLNKMDIVSADAALPPGLRVSAREGKGLEAVLAAIDAALTADPLETVEFRIPQSEGRVIAALERGATVETQRYEGNLLFLRVAGPRSLLERYARYAVRD